MTAVCLELRLAAATGDRLDKMHMNKLDGGY